MLPASFCLQPSPSVLVWHSVDIAVYGYPWNFGKVLVTQKAPFGTVTTSPFSKLFEITVIQGILVQCWSFGSRRRSTTTLLPTRNILLHDISIMRFLYCSCWRNTPSDSTSINSGADPAFIKSALLCLKIFWEKCFWDLYILKRKNPSPLF